jgi:hypothetical protein
LLFDFIYFKKNHFFLLSFLAGAAAYGLAGAAAYGLAGAAA